MSWTYINKHGIRLKGTSNGYYTLQIIDETDDAISSVDFERGDVHIMRELAHNLLRAAVDLEKQTK